LPNLLAAQTATIPNDHASDRGKAMVALHSQGAQHRATHRRGDVVHPEDVDHDRDDRTGLKTPITIATTAVAIPRPRCRRRAPRRRMAPVRRSRHAGGARERA